MAKTFVRLIRYKKSEIIFEKIYDLSNIKDITFQTVEKYTYNELINRGIDKIEETEIVEILFANYPDKHINISTHHEEDIFIREYIIQLFSD
jgi:hypothetical protein